MKGSTPLPFLEEALETLRETSLVESRNQTLTVTDSCRRSYETDERRAAHFEEVIAADLWEEDDAEQMVGNIFDLLEQAISPSGRDDPDQDDGLRLPRLPDFSIYREGMVGDPFRARQADASVLPGEEVPPVDFSALDPGAEVEHVELEIALVGIKPGSAGSWSCPGRWAWIRPCG